MSTNFPTALDSFTNPTAANHLDDVPVLHSTQHANTNDSILALETKLGINFSVVANSLDFITKMLLMTTTQHQNGGYREFSYVDNRPPIVNTVIWYTDSGKTIKLVEKEFTYGAIRILPTSVTLRLYDGTVANTIQRTITDTIVYDRVFETSRTRIVT